MAQTTSYKTYTKYAKHNMRIIGGSLQKSEQNNKLAAKEIPRWSHHEEYIIESRRSMRISIKVVDLTHYAAATLQ
jgi:hypothetical protein